MVPRLNSYGDPGYDRTAETRDGRKVMYNRNAPLENCGYRTLLMRHWYCMGKTPPTPRTGTGKKESYEGGCNTPFIIHWPAGLKTKPGSITTQMGHVMDVAATCLDVYRCDISN